MRALISVRIVLPIVNSDKETSSTPAKRRPPVRLIVVGVLALLSLVLVLQNRDTVDTKIFFATISMPRAVLLAVTFLLGVIVGLLVPFLRKRAS